MIRIDSIEHLAFDSAEALLLREYLIERRHYALMLDSADQALVTCRTLATWQDSLIGLTQRQVRLADQQRRAARIQRAELHDQLKAIRRERWIERAAYGFSLGLILSML